MSIILLSSTLLLPATKVRANPITSIQSPQSIYLAIRQVTFFQTNDFETELYVKFYIGGFFSLNRTFCGIQPQLSAYINKVYYASIYFNNVTGNSQSLCAWNGNENTTAFFAPSFGGFLSSLFIPFDVYSFNITLIGDPNVAYRADSLVYPALDFPASHNYVLNSTFRNGTTPTGRTVFSYLITFSFPLEQRMGWIVNVVVYFGAFIGGIAAVLSLLQRLKKRLRRADVDRFLGVGY